MEDELEQCKEIQAKKDEAFKWAIFQMLDVGVFTLVACIAGFASKDIWYLCAGWCIGTYLSYLNKVSKICESSR